MTRDLQIYCRKFFQIILLSGFLIVSQTSLAHDDLQTTFALQDIQFTLQSIESEIFTLQRIGSEISDMESSVSSVKRKLDDVCSELRKIKKAIKTIPGVGYVRTSSC